MTTATQTAATTLQDRLAAIDLATVPVMTTDRCIPRKEQAALARKLFKLLGLKGISVTTPNYSMAQSVDVKLPADRPTDADFIWGGVDYRHHTYSDMPETVPARAMSLAHYAAGRRVEAILLAAFPNHDNRSEYQSDYFDYCWSVS